MDQVGILTMYKLQNTAEPGLLPAEKLVSVGSAYYHELRISYTRAFAAMSASQRIDRLVRAEKIDIPDDAEYVILEDGLQYRIAMKQRYNMDCDLTLVRLEDLYDVATE